MKIMMIQFGLWLFFSWNLEEDAKLVRLQKIYGNRWTKIADALGRNQREVQGRFNRYILPNYGHCGGK